jgi:sirohydrochlorin cobaltochelatase
MMLKRAADPTTTLLLAAHGSSRPGGHNPVRELARQLNKLDLFANVLCGFLKESPFLSQALYQVATPNLTVVPMMSGHGYISDEMVPRALRAVSSATTVHQCPPLGTAEKIPAIMAMRVQSVIGEQNLGLDRISILVAAHGNKQNPRNARQATAIASQIETLMNGVETRAAFIEEAPLISDWAKITKGDHLIVLPYLIGGGLHGAEDIPEMLGIETHDPGFSQPGEAPCAGPISARGRSIWFCQALGREAALVDIILNLASKRSTV